MSTPKIVPEHPPRKIVNYPIPGDPKGGALFIYGDADAKKMVLMSPGFADDQTMFAPFATRLANDDAGSNTKALVGVACMPGYDNREDKPWTEHRRDKKDGYSFEEWATCMREAAKALRSESSLPSKPKFTGIFADWAFFPGAMWSNRAIEDGSDNAPDELVYFDVLPAVHPNPTSSGGHKQETGAELSSKGTMYELICGTYYQLVLSVAFLLQRYIASAAAIIWLPFGLLPMWILRLGPCLKLDDDVIMNKAQPPSIPHMMYMCYPYKNMYKEMFSDSFRWNRKIKLTLQDFTLPKDLSKVPVLYMYGTEKRTAFHEYTSVRFLEREHEENGSKSNVIAVSGAGHYLYVQKFDLCFDAVSSFMQKE